MPLNPTCPIVTPAHDVKPLVFVWTALLCLLIRSSCAAAEEGALAGTKALSTEGDLSAEMVAGADRFLMREIERSVGERSKLWKRDFSSPEAYQKSIQPNRERFRKAIGAVDRRLP